MKRNAYALLAALLMASGTAAGAMPAGTSTSGVTITDSKDAPNQGFCDLHISASFKTHTPGVHSRKDLHGTPEYQVLVTIDGREVPLKASVQVEKTEEVPGAAETGPGMRYLLGSTVRLPAGVHTVTVAIPSDGIVVQRQVTLSDRSRNTLRLEPQYRWVPGNRNGFYRFTRFEEGLKGFQVVLNGQPL